MRMRTLAGSLSASICLLAIGCTAGVTSNPPAPVTPVTPTSSAPATVPAPEIVAWGDSLTQGMQGEFDVGDYPDDMQPLMTLPIINEGDDGQTSTQIGVREGAIPTYATVQDGVIPASGGVQVAFPIGYEPVNSNLAKGAAGTILGVHGVVTEDWSTGISTFTRSTAGAAVNAPGSPQFVLDTPYSNDLPVFWEGRNNFGHTAQIMSDLAAQITTVTPGMNYAVLSIIPMARQAEWEGRTDYRILMTDNADLQQAYGSHYIDVWTPLVNAYDPTQATDVADYNVKEIPTSLRPVYVKGTLANAIGPADTTISIQVISSQQWMLPFLRYAGMVTIDSGASAENALIVSYSGNVVTVQRGYNGNQTNHAAGVPVQAIDVVHVNNTGNQIIANLIANYLSAYKKP